jgi:hypothetical protein
MSTPLNHHHVSQCQIKQFFDSEGEIFLYDKAKHNFYSKRSAKNIFSEKLANSIYMNGEVDHESLEADLKIFEDNYPNAVDQITDAIKKCKISTDCHHVLLDITLFGIIGRLRTPEHKKELDNIIDNMFNQFEDLMADEQKKSLEQTKEYKKHVKYSNLLSYTDTALRIVKRMGGLDFTIWHIEGDDCFLLPDTSAISIRKQINKYLNPHVREIAEVGFPLTDKIFIHALSKKLGQRKSYFCFVDKNDDKSVTDINFNLFHFAYNTVATSNEEYLRKIVSQVKDQTF